MNADHLTTTTAAQKDEIKVCVEIIVKQIDRKDSICFCLVLTLPPQDKLTSKMPRERLSRGMFVKSNRVDQPVEMRTEKEINLLSRSASNLFTPLSGTTLGWVEFCVLFPNGTYAKYLRSTQSR